MFQNKVKGRKLGPKVAGNLERTCGCDRRAFRLLGFDFIFNVNPIEWFWQIALSSLENIDSRQFQHDDVDVPDHWHALDSIRRHF